MSRLRLIPPVRLILPVLLAALAASGCVHRALIVESEPPGAEVWIDGELAGLTPVRTPFSHYGAREIAVVKGGHALVRSRLEVEPPWYERFPLDFFAENLWPLTLTDERYFIFRLVPEQGDPDAVMSRAGAFRKGGP